MRVVIAPPFYWGICQSTGGFIGSFHVRKETAKSLLFDILASLAGFGFRNVYGINAHGDIEHNVVLIETFRQACEQLSINASYTFSESILHHYGLMGGEPYICPIKQQMIQVRMSNYADVHGGDIETATINHFYPDLVDTRIAKKLPPVYLEDDKIMTWLYGGHTKQLSPEGYLGTPADYVSVEVMKNINDIADRVAQAILEHMRRQEANGS